MRGWIAALCVKALGWNELALRLPSLVAAALTCAIVFAWSQRNLGLRAGMWTAAALLLSHFFIDAARQPRMDSMLALFVTAAIVSLERAITKSGQVEAKTTSPPTSLVSSVSSPTRTSAQWFILAAGALGLGALTKGILGIVLPGLVIVAFLLIRGRWKELFRFNLVATFTAGMAIGLAWFVAGYELGGRTFVEWQVRMNLWSRFIPAAAGGANYCVHPWWYFAPQILTGFLPWSLYLPAFALAAWGLKRHQLPEPLVYTLCWFVALFIFFSSSRGKCLIYILPAFPPLSILVGWTVASAQTAAENRRGFVALFAAGAATTAFGAIILVAGALVVIGCGISPQAGLRLHSTDRRFLELLLQQDSNPRLLLWAAISLVGSALTAIGLLRKMPNFEGFGTLIIAAAGGWFWFAVMNPALAKGETLKAFAREAAALVPRNAVIGHFGLGDCELNFYSPRSLTPISRISCSGRQPDEQYILIRQRDLNAIPIVRRACFSTELQAIPNDSIGPRLLIHRTAPGNSSPGRLGLGNVVLRP